MSQTWKPPKLPWIAYWPLKARSELMFERNSGGGGVRESTRRFHTASPASNMPALRPTRGSRPDGGCCTTPSTMMMGPELAGVVEVVRVVVGVGAGSDAAG